MGTLTGAEREERGRELGSASRREHQAMVGLGTVTTQEDWDATKARAVEDWHSGARLLEMAGGTRYLAPDRAALLVALWHSYIDHYRPSGPAEYQVIAMALMSWYHFERVNELICNLQAKAELSLFGPAGVEVHVRTKGGPSYYEKQEAEVYATEYLRQLGQDALPLLDRLQRMVARSLRMLRDVRNLPAPVEAPAAPAAEPVPIGRRRRRA